MEKTSEFLELLLEFENKYCNSSKIVNSQMMYWNYKIQGNSSLKEIVPEIDNWVYLYEQFLDCGGDTYHLKQGTFLGQFF